MITRANYEQFFLDFHEAALDTATGKELYAFLDQNPDLREEFESFVELKIEPELNITLLNKARLHRSEINDRNYLTRLIAFLENDLDENGKGSTEKYIKEHPEVAKELEILRKTRIQPDYSVIFRAKSNLKKESKVIVFSKTFYRTAAIAASLIILLLSYFVFIISKQESVITKQEKQTETPALVEIKRPAIIQTQKEDHVLISGQKSQTDSNAPKNFESIQKLADQTPQKYQNVELLKETQPATQQMTQSVPDRHETMRKEFPVLSDPLNTLAETVNAKNESPVIEATDLSSVFSREELAELGVTSQATENVKTLNAWDIAETGVEKLGNVIGTKMELDKKAGASENITTYALAIGNFSVSRTRVR